MPWKRKAPALDRYEGEAGLRRVRNTLARNSSVEKDENIIDALMAAGEPVAFARGHAFIQNGADDDEVYFLLSGEAQIILPGRRRARRITPNQVGEMAAMDTGQKRSATVKAGSEGTVAWKVDADDLRALFGAHPEFLARMRSETTRRHRQLTSNTPAMMEANWLVWTGLSILAAVIAWLALWFGLGAADTPPMWKAIISAGGGLAAFLFVVSRNPAFFWRQAIGLLILLPVLYLLQRTISFELDDGSGVKKFTISSESAEMNPSITLAIIAGWLIVLVTCSYFENRRVNDG